MKYIFNMIYLIRAYYQGWNYSFAMPKNDALGSLEIKSSFDAFTYRLSPALSLNTPLV